MHAMGPNVAGVIGSAVAAGIYCLFYHKLLLGLSSGEGPVLFVYP
jgi:hypothetical protein